MPTAWIQRRTRMPRCRRRQPGSGRRRPSGTRLRRRAPTPRRAVGAGTRFIAFVIGHSAVRQEARSLSWEQGRDFLSKVSAILPLDEEIADFAGDYARWVNTQFFKEFHAAEA